MTWMAASDIHGSSLWCRRLLDAAEREKPDGLLLLGDLLYHGPRNDLPEGYAPKEVITMLNAYEGRLIAVRGNCDAEIDQTVLNFPIMADYALLMIGGRCVYASHGHLYDDLRLPLRVGDYLLQGHTHVPCWAERDDGVTVLNPGSVSLPKDGSPRGYLMIDEEGVVWKDMDGITYHRVDF